MEYIKDYNVNLYNHMVLLHEKMNRELFIQKHNKFHQAKALKEKDIFPPASDIQDILNVAFEFMGITQAEFEETATSFLKYIQQMPRYSCQNETDVFWKQEIDKKWLCLNLMVQTTWYNHIYSHLVQMEKLYNNPTLYDYGCGSGVFTILLGRAFAAKEIVLSDLDNYAAKFIKYYIEKTQAKNIRWENILDQHEQKEKFDVVVCLDVLEHLENSYDHLLKLDNLLKKDGVLALKIAFEVEDKTHLPQASEHFFINNDGYGYLKKNYHLEKKFYNLELINGIYIKQDMKKPKVSIICRTYNQENLVGKTIDSVLNQTFKDFELIVIDDNSTDKTAEQVLSFNDDRITLIKNEVNIGPMNNLNEGIKYAHGEYIAVLDGDDECLPQKLQKQVDFLDANPDYGAVFSYIETIDEYGNIITCPRLSSIKSLINNPAGSRAEMLRKCFAAYNFLAFSTELFRKECAIHFNEHLLACGDGYFHIDLLLKKKVKVLEEPLVKYRILTNNKNVSSWTNGLSKESEIMFLLDKFLEIDDVEFFKEIFKDEASEFGEPRVETIPYILSRIAGKDVDVYKGRWASYTYHRFISKRENVEYLKKFYNFRFQQILEVKRWGVRS